MSGLAADADAAAGEVGREGDVESVVEISVLRSCARFITSDIEASTRDLGSRSPSISAATCNKDTHTIYDNQ